MSTTPIEHSGQRSNSRPRAPSSRPTTPLRPSSRSSFLESGRSSAAGVSDAPLDVFEPAFAELSDSMADLEANFMHLQLMHESLARFSENFASFLYGLNMNAFCVDFPEAPIPESFARQNQQEQYDTEHPGQLRDDDAASEITFMTTETTFVENPSTASKPTPKFSTPVPSSKRGAASGRGSSSSTTTRGIPRGRIPRGSGLARASARGRGR